MTTSSEIRYHKKYIPPPEVSITGRFEEQDERFLCTDPEDCLKNPERRLYLAVHDNYTHVKFRSGLG